MLSRFESIEIYILYFYKSDEKTHFYGKKIIKTDPSHVLGALRPKLGGSNTTDTADKRVKESMRLWGAKPWKLKREYQSMEQSRSQLVKLVT